MTRAILSKENYKIVGDAELCPWHMVFGREPSRNAESLFFLTNFSRFFGYYLLRQTMQKIIRKFRMIKAPSIFGALIQTRKFARRTAFTVGCLGKEIKLCSRDLLLKMSTKDFSYKEIQSKNLPRKMLRPRMDSLAFASSLHNS